MKVDIEDILEQMNFMWWINGLTKLENIEWYYDGEKVDVTDEELEEWKFTGLNNTDFAVTYLLDKNS